MTAPFSPLRFADDTLFLLDQTRLPGEETWLACATPEAVGEAILRLAVRGAPAIGVAAAYGLVLAVRRAAAQGLAGDHLLAAIHRDAEALAATRPTAVNLRWAVRRGLAALAALPDRDPAALVAALTRWARQVEADDVAANAAMADHGAPLLAAARRPGRPGARVLTHCNAGALATAGWGTAVGVIVRAWQQGTIELVWVDETRPLLQGARLTAWELARLGIPHRLITDSMAASVMARGEIDAVIVGADRIAANGDVANKIGTYGVAVLAHHHHLPFYVAAPVSTIDPATPDGAAIPIEERSRDEVAHFAGHPTAPAATPVHNPAFDVTPAALVHAIVCERGVLRPPFSPAIAGVTG
jgi:methylthioribose-1-phosphate isomerase